MTDENYEIPDVEKLTIAKEFLRYAPPGEFNQVINNLSVILDKPLDKNEQIHACALDYHQDQLTTVFVDEEKQEKYQQYLTLRNSGNAGKLAAMGDVSEFYEDNGNCIISEQSHIKDNTFLHVNENLMFSFNPVTQLVSDIEIAPANYRPIKAEGLRTSLENEISNYVNQHYPKGVYSVHTNIYPDSESENSNEFVILIEDHEFQPQNRWNGKWRSEWLVTINDKVMLQGGAKVHVHYYEDSNVQLVTKQLYDQIQVENTTSETDNKKIALNIVKIILKLENKYQQSLRDNYVTMNDTIFKSLRRILPVTKTKFNWDNIDYLKIGKEINKKEGNLI